MYRSNAEIELNKIQKTRILDRFNLKSTQSREAAENKLHYKRHA